MIQSRGNTHMDASILPAARYDPHVPGGTQALSPLARNRNTLIEDEPQSTRGTLFPRAIYRPPKRSPGPHDDLPTPKASLHNLPTPPSSTEVSPATPSGKNGAGKVQFDPELYDVSDNEEEVPLKCSASVKHMSGSSTGSGRNRYPSLIIPSPSAWPTIQKLQKSGISPRPPIPISPVPVMPSPKVLLHLAARNARMARVPSPSPSGTPSLDGSLTSEELEKMSCPSTPDMNGAADDDQPWSAPVQLHPEALDTLHRLSGDGTDLRSNEVVEASLEISGEMQEVSNQSMQGRGVGIAFSPVEFDSHDELSALTVPSPGGFFSSLGSSARHTWCASSSATGPPTSVAENFYGVPWQDPNAPPVPPVPRIVEVPSPASDEGPPTARQETFAGGEDVQELRVSTTYDQNYEQELQKSASAHIDQTASWIAAQERYLANCLNTSPLADMTSPKTASPKETSPTETISQRKDSMDIQRAMPDSQKSSPDLSRKQSKKSVRFADDIPKPPSPVKEEEDKSNKDATFINGFKHVRHKSRKGDVTVHRRTRAEAMHVLLQSLLAAHQDQLMGRYNLITPVRPSAPRPVSHFYTDETNEFKEMIARVHAERQALEQLQPALWHLEALKMTCGGKLFTSPMGKMLKSFRGAMVLDLGGDAQCDWAWQVALDNPRSMVYTCSTARSASEIDLEGPKNHRTQVVPNLWTLPFPNEHFDVISARTLYAFLRMIKRKGKAVDEYDLCLQECMRVLRPGGYVEFALIDADIVRPGHHGTALSAEFTYNLKTRGYDSNPTRTFIPRLKRAGFGDIKRAWMILPMAQTMTKPPDVLGEKDIGPDGEVNPTEMGTTMDASFMTGLMGAWAWEKWLLKLHLEMGKPEEKLLDGVSAALEEGAKGRAGWRYLSGYARKPSS